MESLSTRLEKLEAHLSVISVDRVRQLEDKLENVCDDVNLGIMPSLNGIMSQVLVTEKTSEKNSERITRLESALDNMKDKEDVQENISHREEIARIQGIEQKLDFVSSHVNNLSSECIERIHKLGTEINQIALENNSVRPKVGDTANAANGVEVSSARENKTKEIKEKAYKFISTVSVHGVARIVKTDNSVVKLVWTVMILTSVSFGVYNISKSFSDYYKYDVITNIERITPKTVTFPAITICSLGYISKVTYVNQRRNNSEIIYDDNVSQLNHFITSVSFKGERLNASQLDYFKIPKENGNCVRFNGFSNKNLWTVKDTTSGLYFEIYNVYYLHIDHQFYYKFYLIDRNYEVYIGENDLNSYLNASHLKLLYGSENDVSFEKTVIEKRVNSPRFPCFESENKTYHQMNCIEDCIYKETRIKFNCSFPSFYSKYDLQDCGNRSIMYIYEESSYHIDYIDSINVLKNEFYKICEQKCPTECDSTQFKVTVEKSDGWILKVHFRYSDLSSLNIKQISKMNEYNLIASIGGSLGLFIGVRFLSFVEVMELFIDMFFVLFI